MKNIQRNILKWLGYSAFSLFTFLLFLYITFPCEAILRRLDAEIARASSGKVTLKTKKLELAGISGIRLKEVNLFITSNEGAPPTRLTVDSLEVKVHIFKTVKRLINKANGIMLGPIGGIDLKMVQGSGSLILAITEEEKEASLFANMEELRLERVLPAFVSLPLPISAVTSGKLEAKIKKQWYTNSRATLELSLRNCSIGEGSIKTPFGPFELPLIDSGTLSTTLLLENGALKVDKWQQSGKDLLESDISGKVTLQKKMESSVLDLGISIKPASEFLAKHSKFGAMFSMAGLKKDSDESYSFILTGRFSSPKIKGGKRRPTRPETP